jgi:hypothetical protein
MVLYFTGVAQRADEFSTAHLDFYQKNVKITEIKKEVFLKKIKGIGITKEVLKEYPGLKNKIEEKFNEKVLGKKYFGKLEECQKGLEYQCSEGEVEFLDDDGCGCKKFYR